MTTASSSRPINRAARTSSPDHEVVIIGAGFSGIGAGIKLKRNGIDDFVILERADEVGGTWRDNTYPGVAVDIPSVTYSFHFEPNPQWSRLYAPGRELQQYALDCVAKYDVRPHVRLKSEVAQAVFDEANDLWRVQLTDGTEVAGRYLISAHGALVTPLEPDIPGLNDFTGKILRTQKWDHDHDLSGEKVAVIGTGATALQIIPAIAPDVDRLDVYQRTPIWVIPKIDPAIPAAIRALFRVIPATQKSLRVAGIVASELGLTLAAVYHRQLPVLTKIFEHICNAHRYLQVRDPQLRAKLTPRYGFGCKRPSFSNEYHRAFRRDNVDLITDSIAEITANGIRTVDGTYREIDTLVLATGFKVFDVPYRIHGLAGIEIQDLWDRERAQSYQGITLPQFPNLFLSPGPYGVTGYSWFSNVDLNATHAVRIIKAARQRGATRTAIKPTAYRKTLKRFQNAVRHTVFISGGCVGANTYYIDKNGDAPFLRPTTGLEAWFSHHYVDTDNYAYTTQTAHHARAETSLAEADA